MAEGTRIMVDLPMVRFSDGPTVDRSVPTLPAMGAAATVGVLVAVVPLITAGACASAVVATSVAAMATQRGADKELRKGFFMVFP